MATTASRSRPTTSWTSSSSPIRPIHKGDSTGRPFFWGSSEKWIGKDAALLANEPLAKAYYLKEALRRVWRQQNKDSADIVLSDRIRQAAESNVAILQGMADTIEKHRDGILAWYDYHTSTGKIEGINNKINTMKRQAYGFRDMDFFKLKIYSLHDSTYAFSG